MLRCWIAALGLFAASSVARADEPKPAPAPLELPAVLASVEAHHPLIAVERANAEAAEAEARSARGEFDPTLTVEGRGAPAGYYDPRRFDMRVDQPTPVLGASLYAGYRVTKGKVADYYGEQRTLSGGELRGGLRVPVLQGRSIDGRRAGVQSTQALARASDEAYQTLILDMERQAAQTVPT